MRHSKRHLLLAYKCEIGRQQARGIDIELFNLAALSLPYSSVFRPSTKHLFLLDVVVRYGKIIPMFCAGSSPHLLCRRTCTGLAIMERKAYFQLSKVWPFCDYLCAGMLFHESTSSILNFKQCSFRYCKLHKGNNCYIMIQTQPLLKPCCCPPHLLISNFLSVLVPMICGIWTPANSTLEVYKNLILSFLCLSPSSFVTGAIKHTLVLTIYVLSLSLK